MRFGERPDRQRKASPSRPVQATRSRTSRPAASNHASSTSSSTTSAPAQRKRPSVHVVPRLPGHLGLRDRGWKLRHRRRDCLDGLGKGHRRGDLRSLWSRLGRGRPSRRGCREDDRLHLRRRGCCRRHRTAGPSALSDRHPGRADDARGQEAAEAEEHDGDAPGRPQVEPAASLGRELQGHRLLRLPVGLAVDRGGPPLAEVVVGAAGASDDDLHRQVDVLTARRRKLPDHTVVAHDHRVIPPSLVAIRSAQGHGHGVDLRVLAVCLSRGGRVRRRSLEQVLAVHHHRSAFRREQLVGHLLGVEGRIGNVAGCGRAEGLGVRHGGLQGMGRWDGMGREARGVRRPQPDGTRERTRRRRQERKEGGKLRVGMRRSACRAARGEHNTG